MEAVGTPAVATELHLLREPWRAADPDDTDQDLMFPACGSTEPYYSPERGSIVRPVQTSLCPYQSPNFVFLYGHAMRTLLLFQKGEL
jgi:hypothetical protein